jgi:hypothetical protein
MERPGRIVASLGKVARSYVTLFMDAKLPFMILNNADHTHLLRLFPPQSEKELTANTAAYCEETPRAIERDLENRPVFLNTYS